MIKKLHKLVNFFVFLSIFFIYIYKVHSSEAIRPHSATTQKDTVKDPTSSNCPITLKQWIDDDFEDKRAIWGWPMKSEAQTCQTSIKKYISHVQSSSSSNRLSIESHMSKKLAHKINPTFNNYFNGCALTPEKLSALKTRFYASSAKLETVNSMIIDEVAAIDSILPNSNFLEKIDCTSAWPDIVSKCSKLKQNMRSCQISKQQKLDELIQETQEKIPKIEMLISAQHNCINQIYQDSAKERIGHGFSKNVQNKIHEVCDSFSETAKEMAKSIPWISGESFQKIAIKKKSAPRNGIFSTTYDLSTDTISKAITSQLENNRTAYQTEYTKNLSDFRCLTDKSDKAPEHCDFKNIRTRLAALPDFKQLPFTTKDSLDIEAAQHFQAESCLIARGEDREQTKSKVDGPIVTTVKIGASVIAGLAISAASAGTADILFARQAITAGLSFVSRARQTMNGFNSLNTLQKLAVASSAGMFTNSVHSVGHTNYQYCKQDKEYIIQLEKQADPTIENICPNKKHGLSQAKAKHNHCLAATMMSVPMLIPFIKKNPSLEKMLLAEATELQVTETAMSSLAKTKLPALKGIFDPHEQKVLNAVNRYERDARFFNVGSTESKKAISNLQDGTYVYVIDSKGRMAMINRTMKPQAGDNPQQNMGNHDGLVEFIAAKTREKSEIVSAGEYIVRGKQVVAITNQSGSFRGEAESLKYAQSVFESAGAKIQASTKVINFDKNGNAINTVHSRAADDVRLSLELRANPDYSKLWDETSHTMASIQSKMTQKEFDTQLFAIIKKDGATSDVSNTANFAGLWFNPREGEAWIIDKALKGTVHRREAANLEGLNSILRRIENSKN